jgi:predicted CXXCH cytochrome family protein
MKNTTLIKCTILVTALCFGFATFFNADVHSKTTQEKDLPRVDQTQYLGSDKCAACHKGHYASWKDSAHNKMIRPVIADGPNKNVQADFSKSDPNRPFELKEVKWVIGHRWKQRFIGVVNGEEVVFPAQWSIKDKKWQAYTAKTDWWYPQHPDWKTRSNFKLCAGCHSTGSDHYTQSWTELNISCESCHGPGKKHAESLAKSDIVNPARLSVERSIEVCLACHQAGKPDVKEYAWPVGYQPGKKLSDFWKGFEPEAGKQTPEFWNNGTAHKNRVQGNTFLQSVMHGQGLQCSNCHDAHGSRYQSMTIKSAATNALCLTCHGPGKFVGPKFQDISEHTHHLATSTGSQCINCHMPKTGENSVGAEARDHTFNFVSPAVSIDNPNPNSCNLCHTDKTPQWALEVVKNWHPKLK